MPSASLRTTTSFPQPEALLGAALVLYIGIGAASFYWITYLGSLAFAYFVGRMNLNDKGLWVILSIGFICGLGSIWFLEPFGIFGNRNILGCFAALALAGALVHRLWLFAPFALFALWFAGSLTGIVAACVAVGLWVSREDRAFGYMVLIGAIALALALAHGHNSSFAHRLGIWHDTIDHLTAFGAGLGSFQADYTSWPNHINMYSGADFHNGGWAQHAYNDFLEITYSLGIGSVLLWFFIGLHLEAPDWKNRLIFFTFAACGLSFFPAFLPGLGHIGALTLGRLYHGKMAPSGLALYQRSRI